MVCIILIFNVSVSAEDFVYNGKDKLVFSRFLMLESARNDGQLLEMNDSTPGVVSYTGGTLPSTLEIGNVMYTFTSFFTVSEIADITDISLYMGLTEYPYTLYLNGAEIFRKGRNTPENYNSSMRAAYGVLLPPSLLRKTDRNEIVLQIYPRGETSALDIVYLDTPENVSLAVFIRNFIGINLIQGAFVLSLIIGLYFFILYLAEKQRQRDRLIFALFCFSYFFASIAIATHHDTNNEVLMENLSKFGLLLSVTFILRFFIVFTRVFNTNTALAIVLYACGFVSAIGSLIQPSKTALTVWFSAAIAFVIVPQLLLCIVILCIAICKNKQKAALFLLFAFSVMIAAVVHDVSYLARDALPYAWLITYGYFSIVLAIFALLAEEQARMYHESLQSEADILVDRNRIRMLNEQLIKQKDSFFRFVPTEFLQLLGRNSVVDIKLGDSSLRFLTILFTDIRRFTSMAEGMLPMEIFEFLNAYLFRMEKAVQGNRGFVDKYIGDGVMALFPSDNGGPAKGKSESADNSLRAVLRIKRELHAFNEEKKAQNILPIQIGVGVNTGDVTLGTVGSETRLDTTVIGDAVNLASRLESLTKYYRTQNLISEYTVESLLKPEEFCLRQIDTVSVPGRSGPLRVYELLDPEISSDLNKKESMADFAEALLLYRAREFDKARAIFLKLLENDPDDHVPLVYVERCEAYQQNMPDSSWTGIFRIIEK